MSPISRSVLWLTLLLSLSACATQRPPPPPSSDPTILDTTLSDDEADFRDSIANSIGAIDRFCEQTQTGKNLSDYTLGLFVSNLLATLSGQDIKIANHIFEGGRLTDSYLSEVFQYHPTMEIAYFDALESSANPAFHHAVARALDVLQYIPDPHSPEKKQASDRKMLLKSLTALKAELTKILVSRSN